MPAELTHRFRFTENGAPLAERIRPQKKRDYISQSHLVGPNGSLTQQIIKELFLP
jgi:replication-associated recombination protein RarA